MEKFIEKLTSPAVIISAIIVFAAIGCWVLIKKLLKNYFNREDVKERLRGKPETRIKVVVQLLKYAIVIVAAIAVLQINGINVSSLVAGLGIASAIAGLALQDILKDIIMGSHIITDEFFAIGDVIQYGGIEGKVVSFTVRTTKIRDIETDHVISVCNRNISEITKSSNQFDIDLPLSYREDPGKVAEMLKGVCREAKEIEEIKDCMFLGAESFDEYSVAYKIRVFCNPVIKPTLRRAVLGMIQTSLEKNQIVIPFRQLDIHRIEN